MDFFTHLMLGYLTASWFCGTFSLSDTCVMFGSLVGVIPDLDIFLYPLWKKHPMLGHHGISHTLAFAFVSSTLIFATVSAVSGFPGFRLLVLMYITSLCHPLFDSLTTWGVSLFYPLSKRHIKANIDTAVNPILIAFFFVAMFLLVLGYQHHKPFRDVWDASYLLAFAYCGYFATKALLKLRVSLRPENEGFTAIATMSPFRWKLAKRSEDRKEIRVVFREENGDRTYHIPKNKVSQVEKLDDVVPYTYWHPQMQVYLNVFEFPYYRIKQKGDAIEISWSTVEMARNMAITARLENGRLKIESWF